MKNHHILGITAALLFGAGVCLTVTLPANALTITSKPVTGTSSGANLGGGGPSYFAQVFGNFNNTGFIGPQNGAPAFKGSATSTSNTGQLLGPNAGATGEFVQAVVTSTGSLGVFSATNTWSLVVTGQTDAFSTLVGRGRYVDPYNLTILNTGFVLTAEQGLQMGSQIQVQDPRVPGTLPLVLEARFGQGNFPADDPGKFWPANASPPAGTFDLFHIEIFANSAGKIDAIAQLFSSPNSDYSVSFNKTQTALENEIRNATWGSSGNFFTLQSDLSDLLDATVTRLTAVPPSGVMAEIGYRGTIDVSAVPEPSALLLVATCISGLAVITWRRHRK